MHCRSIISLVAFLPLAALGVPETQAGNRYRLQRVFKLPLILDETCAQAWVRHGVSDPEVSEMIKSDPARLSEPANPFPVHSFVNVEDGVCIIRLFSIR